MRDEFSFLSGTTHRTHSHSTANTSVQFFFFGQGGAPVLYVLVLVCCRNTQRRDIWKKSTPGKKSVFFYSWRWSVSADSGQHWTRGSKPPSEESSQRYVFSRTINRAQTVRTVDGRLSVSFLPQKVDRPLYKPFFLSKKKCVIGFLFSPCGKTG